MSPSIKLGLLTLVSTAAAIPHYGAHVKFHNRAGGYGEMPPPVPYPIDSNSTAAAVTGPTGTGAAVPEGTTTILESLSSTVTLVQTVYATPSPVGEGQGAAPSSVGAAGATGGVCGPATVYVTATNRVTVTVPSGSASAPVSSEAVSSAVVEASSAPAPAPSPVSAPVVPEAVSSKPVTPEMSILPVTSAPVASAPVESAPAATSEVAAPSSPAPSPSGTPSGSTPVYSGGKRGLAYNEPGLCSSFDSSKFAFSYNWGATPYNGECSSTKFIPMMHSPSQMSSQDFLSAVEESISKGADAVMGFNEPDHAAQANLSPEDACSKWSEYMEPIAQNHKDVTILGPSVTNGPAPMGLDWLSRFQSACPDATWHAANIHFYDDYNEGVSQRFKDHCEQAAKDYGKKIWVTEFGLNPGTATDEQAAQFLQEAMEYMEGSDNIAGYAYFMVGTSAMQLNNGNGLSVVGQAYNS